MSDEKMSRDKANEIAIEYLKTLSREDLIVTLFDTFSSTEKDMFLKLTFYKYVNNILFK